MSSLRLAPQPARNGFSLIELMIVVAIIGILASVAYPSYQSYIVRTNRSIATAYLLDVATRQQQYRLDARTFGSLSDIGMSTPPGDVSKNYTVSIVGTPTATTFTVQAAPIAGSTQATKDAKCGTLTLNQAGAKSIGGSGNAADCWGGK